MLSFGFKVGVTVGLGRGSVGSWVVCRGYESPRKDRTTREFVCVVNIQSSACGNECVLCLPKRNSNN